MADYTQTQNKIALAEGSTVKIRETGQTDWEIVSKIIDSDVIFNRIGGSPMEFPAHNGETLIIPQGADAWESSEMNIWVTVQDLKVLGYGFGSSTSAGTAPYVYTFSGDGENKIVDLNWTNATFDDANRSLEINAGTGTMEVVSIGAAFENKFQMSVKFKFGAQNFEIKQSSTTALS